MFLILISPEAKERFDSGGKHRQMQISIQLFMTIPDELLACRRRMILCIPLDGSLIPTQASADCTINAFRYCLERRTSSILFLGDDLTKSKPGYQPCTNEDIQQ